MVTLSRKHQVTLPVAALREAGLGPGDKLLVEVLDGAVLLIPMLPEEREPPVTVYGRTAAEMDTYLRAERESWPPRP